MFTLNIWAADASPKGGRGITPFRVWPDRSAQPTLHGRRHPMNSRFQLRAVAGLALGTVVSVAIAGPVRSVGAMTFADADTVVIADWRAGEIHAVQLPPAVNATAKPFNLKNVSTPIARALGTQPDKLRFEDMAFRPGAELAYITVSVDRGGGVPAPA